jgi:gliding motility-associated lipoprotein GldH
MNNKQKLVKFFKKTLIINSILVFSVWVLSCDNHSIFKSYVDLKDSNWYVKNIPSFTFEVKDEKVPYNIYLLIRNSSQYPYNNLYVTRYIYGPDGKQISNRLEEVTLFNAKTGKPLGEGLGDIFDHKVLSNRNFIFPKKGKYTIKLKQYMRQDPLPYVMSVGVSVEKRLPLKQ